MTFLAEILGFTNDCNLKCSYCGWEKKKVFPLSLEDIESVRKNLLSTHELLKAEFPSTMLIEYLGGEPFVHSEVVYEFLNIFSDYWIRIVTNGLLLSAEILKALKMHGKAYLAISLDGHTVEMNKSRHFSEKQLQQVISNIDSILKEEIPVMILCTINSHNIKDFPKYLEWISIRWNKEIEQGRLVLPVHLVTQYFNCSPDFKKLNKEDLDILQKELTKCTFPIYTQIKPHYSQMFQKQRKCTIPQWLVSFHYLDKSMAENGVFTNYRCGMRGVGKVGEFQITNSQECNQFLKLREESKETHLEQYHCTNYCFVDWTVFDLIFQGVISIEEAENWFVMFQDSKVKDWIVQYQDMQNKKGKKKIKKMFKHTDFEKIKVVIIDLYGTLLTIFDKSQDVNGWICFANFLRYEGISISYRKLRSLYEQCLNDCQELSGQKYNPEVEINICDVFRELLQRLGFPKEENQIIKIAQAYRAIFTGELRVQLGAEELLDALKQTGKQIILLENAQRIYAELELKAVGFDSYFDKMLFSSDFGKRKPSIELMKEIVQQCGVYPNEVLVIGNEKVTDILPANQLWLNTCFVSTDNCNDFEYIVPDFIVEGEDALIQLKQLLLND